jgi:hypothetical protein
MLMANTCREAIEEVFANESDVLETGQVIDRIYGRYPNHPWKPSTICAHLVGLSVNHPSSVHHPHLRRHGFLFSLGKGRYRNWNRTEDGDGPVPPRDEEIEEIEPTPDTLGRWRRSIIQLLNTLESHPNQPEGLVSRIRRISRDGHIPRETVTLMILIVEMRNVVEYEEKRLSLSEKKTIRSAWQAVLEWARRKGISLAP